MPERWDGDAGEAEDKVDAGDDGEAEEPEPQEEEHLRIFTFVERQHKQERMTIIFSFNDDNYDDCYHLFVDYIERENTKAIELLFSSSGAHGVEGAAMKKDQNVKDQKPPPPPTT